MLRLTNRVDAEQCRTTCVYAVDVTFDQVSVIGNVSLKNEGSAVSRTNQPDFLADFGLALPGFTVGSHVGNLTDVTGGAGLAACVGINLGVEYENLEWAS